ncbi:MAG: hypothetical protein IT579_04535 [Verrucomicrobia subdivision 3 bacterium]|nr:hypothetical protein [Limisphaerales bacterium]
MNEIHDSRSELVTVLQTTINEPINPNMKKFILALTVAALTVGVYAGETCPAKDKTACPGKDKACCAEKAKAGCPANKGKCPAQGQTAKPDGNNKPAQSPKAADTNKS